MAREHGVLLISNHVSWLDITVLSAVAPVSFVAKQEVASWPFVSWLAKLQRSVFVDRTRKSEVTGKANEIVNRLQIRRPRGPVRRRHLERRQWRGAVQDAALRRRQAVWRTFRSAPIFAPRPWRLPTPSCAACALCRRGRPVVAWYGDMDLASHAWRLLGLGPLDAHIRIGPPVPLDDFADRKALARYAEAQVRKDVAELLRGRPRLGRVRLTPQALRSLMACGDVFGTKVPSCSCRRCSLRMMLTSVPCTARSALSPSSNSLSFKVRLTRPSFDIGPIFAKPLQDEVGERDLRAPRGAWSGSTFGHAPMLGLHELAKRCQLRLQLRHACIRARFAAARSFFQTAHSNSPIWSSISRARSCKSFLMSRMAPPPHSPHLKSPAQRGPTAAQCGRTFRRNKSAGRNFLWMVTPPPQFAARCPTIPQPLLDFRWTGAFPVSGRKAASRPIAGRKAQT